MRELAVIFHNIRSTHNVGALLRTADGIGVQKVFFTGFTPYPLRKNDSRLPHLAKKIADQIDKTALGAASSVDWEYWQNLSDLLKELRKQDFSLIAFEQSATSIPLHKFKLPSKLAILFGNEVNGLDETVLKDVASHVEIPMLGTKESFNVTSAAAIAMYYARWL